MNTEYNDAINTLRDEMNNNIYQVLYDFYSKGIVNKNRDVLRVKGRAMIFFTPRQAHEKACDYINEFQVTLDKLLEYLIPISFASGTKDKLMTSIYYIWSSIKSVKVARVFTREYVDEQELTDEYEKNLELLHTVNDVFCNLRMSILRFLDNTVKQTLKKYLTKSADDDDEILIIEMCMNMVNIWAYRTIFKDLLETKKIEKVLVDTSIKEIPLHVQQRYYEMNELAGKLIEDLNDDMKQKIFTKLEKHYRSEEMDELIRQIMMRPQDFVENKYCQNGYYIWNPLN